MPSIPAGRALRAVLPVLVALSMGVLSAPASASPAASSAAGVYVAAKAKARKACRDQGKRSRACRKARKRLAKARATARKGKPVKPAPAPSPTVEPTPQPTAAPTVEPTPQPTAAPSVEPTPEPTAAPTVQPTATPAPSLAAPVLRADGTTIRWAQVAGVTRYVMAEKIPGQTTRHFHVTGTSYTPAAQPGKTVNYGLRTDVAGSSWAQEVSVTFPAAEPAPTATPAPTTTPSPTATPQPSPAPAGGFEFGLTSGSDAVNETRYLAPFKAKVVRVEFHVSTLASSTRLRDTIAGHAANGTRVLLLAGFHADMPTVDEARNLAEWAKAYGPGGTFWQGRSDGHLAVREIEFGNETNMGWQYGDNWDKPTYAERARTYALRFKDAHVAIQAANPKVGLLAQGDDAGTGSAVWIDSMYAAVPDLKSRVAGWTVHPYGPRTKWEPRFDRMRTMQAKYGAQDLPIYVTEWGLATDNGTCLSDNYGWDKCMTYAAAATALTESVSQMRAKLGSQLRVFTLYQGHDQYASGYSTNREHYFGALKQNLTEKGAYTPAVRQLLAAS